MSRSRPPLAARRALRVLVCALLTGGRAGLVGARALRARQETELVDEDLFSPRAGRRRRARGRRRARARAPAAARAARRRTARRSR